ncbi:hypothetical protein K505DRAFT_381941 [Melanomma pulvis-pyrius CBS 109.77]|uniref:Uncharacterized protein n=1 Tax=Melanomma pulvis-pyrius CBS 109.77 TaxID=1314802 RepID=A0A6A6XGH8_9PLEO|nr:hypothetical protein K505DRAFT_381941 [Melanomma pulvis-pyrius CBS 109.77]
MPEYRRGASDTRFTRRHQLPLESSNIGTATSSQKGISPISGRTVAAARGCRCSVSRRDTIQPLPTQREINRETASFGLDLRESEESMSARRYVLVSRGRGVYIENHINISNCAVDVQADDLINTAKHLETLEFTTTCQYQHPCHHSTTVTLCPPASYILLCPSASSSSIESEISASVGLFHSSALVRFCRTQRMAGPAVALDPYFAVSSSLVASRYLLSALLPSLQCSSAASL